LNWIQQIKLYASSVAAQKELAQAIKDHYGQLDVAFLNAGVTV